MLKKVSTINYEPERILKHCEFLKDQYYFVETKWPQFQVMFDACDLICKLTSANEKIFIAERAYFYGGYSQFAPLFNERKVYAYDCIYVDETDNRFGLQSDRLESDEYIKHPCDSGGRFEDLGFIKNDSFDLVFVPNVVHHEKNQDVMFRELSRILKPGGDIIIFEGLVRELHHLPDDYVRYTPEGFRHQFSLVNIDLVDTLFGSGVFDVIAYTWQQALDYLPEDVRDKWSDWFWSVHYGKLQELDQKYKANLVKPEKSFPMTYTIHGRKAAESDS